MASGSSLFTGEHSTCWMRVPGGSSARNVATSAVLPMPISPTTARATSAPRGRIDARGGRDCEPAPSSEPLLGGGGALERASPRR